MKTTHVALSVAFLLVCASLIAEVVPPVDDRASWNVAVAEFGGVGLTRENQHLRTSVPVALFEALSPLPEHVLSEEEIDAYRRSLRTGAEKTLRDSLAGAIRERDLLFFKRSATTAEHRRVGERVETARAQLAALEKLEAEEIRVRSVKPVKMVPGSDGPLVAAAGPEPARRAQALSVDLLLWGTVEQIESYVYVEVNALHRATGQTYAFATASSRERLPSALEPVVEDLTALVLGRSWANIRVVAEPANAGIWLDGSFVGRGTVTVEHLPVREHTVSVRQLGYATAERTVLPQESETEVVAITLQSVQTPEATVHTVPAGATLYMASMWEGVTPSTVFVPPLGAHGVLELEGYNRYMFSVQRERDGEVVKQLLPERVDPNAVAEWKRDRFYTALGAFVLSVPIPMMLFDLTNNVTAVLNEWSSDPGGQKELERLVKVRTAALGGYLGSFFVVGALLVNTVIELMEYIRVVDLSLN